MKASLPLVGITMGDPVGVGPEIIPKALADPRVYGGSDCHGCRPGPLAKSSIQSIASRPIQSMNLKPSTQPNP
jgi:4-hydroxy-L-threonine phosphate dehydrogenase PdxA